MLHIKDSSSVSNMEPMIINNNNNYGSNRQEKHVKIGDIYDNSKVVRVDRGLGLLLEVPSIPEPTPAFVSVRSVWTSFNVTKLLQYEI